MTKYHMIFLSTKIKLNLRIEKVTKRAKIEIDCRNSPLELRISETPPLTTSITFTHQSPLVEIFAKFDIPDP